MSSYPPQAATAAVVSSSFCRRSLSSNQKGTMLNEKRSAGELRLLNDIRDCSDIQIPVTISFLDLMNFEVTMLPDEGWYQGGTFVFSFHVPPLYPYEPPKVKCKTKVYHPNIDFEGNVRLDMLGENWCPVLQIKTVIRHVYNLLVRPNPTKTLNHVAAAEMKDNLKQFKSNVQKAMSGLCVRETSFTRCM